MKKETKTNINLVFVGIGVVIGTILFCFLVVYTFGEDIESDSHNYWHVCIDYCVGKYANDVCNNICGCIYEQVNPDICNKIDELK